MHHESPKLLQDAWFIPRAYSGLLGYGRRALSYLGVVVLRPDDRFFIYCTFLMSSITTASPKPGFRGLTKHHNIHHSLRDVNFGVTNRFWVSSLWDTYERDFTTKTVPRRRAVARP